MVFLLATVLFINYVDRGTLPTAAHLMQEDLHLDYTQMGLLMSAFFWTYTFSQIPVGWLAERYGAISREAADEARYFVHTLDDGYKLAFTRSALVFDFAKPGTELPESEGGIEYHRIGVNLIRLVNAPLKTPGASQLVGAYQSPIRRKIVAEPTEPLSIDVVDELIRHQSSRLRPATLPSQKTGGGR